MADTYIAGLNGSHNGGITVSKNGKIVLCLEFERLFNEKNVGVAQYKTIKGSDILTVMEYLGPYVMNKLGIKEFDKLITINTEVNFGGEKRYGMENYFPHKEHVIGFHHLAHAANALYTSPYDRALIVSFDGGGNDGFFNIYLGDKKEKFGHDNFKLLESVVHPTAGSPHLFLDLGLPYAAFGEVLGDIRREGDLSNGILVYPGKIMGLASYGKVRKRWLKKFINYYTQNLHQGNSWKSHIKNLFDEIGIEYNVNLFAERNEEDRLTGSIAHDIAATSQRAFEEAFLLFAKKYIDEHPDLPLLMAGGCALNIILNTRLKKEFDRDVFVGPTPNDSGISTGLCLYGVKPDKPAETTYLGTELIDTDTVFQWINENWWFTSHFIDRDELAQSLIEGKIVGVARGRAEHGPRALGNRSILCNPSINSMKDILNAKVKNREYYRPFAPVVRLEDVSKYFEWEGESRWMTFCPVVKKEWRKKLKAITHVDNTARVQTVTKEQNEFLYDILTRIDKKTGVGVLLNTSFNVAGKPIANSVNDCMTVFKDTELDQLILDNLYFKKCTI